MRRNQGRKTYVCYQLFVQRVSASSMASWVVDCDIFRKQDVVVARKGISNAVENVRLAQ